MIKAAHAVLYWVLSGVTCLAIIVVLLAKLAPLSAPDRVQLAVPPLTGIPAVGRYTEANNTSFPFEPRRRDYLFAPSLNTRIMAPPHTYMDGTTPRIWYDFAPAPSRKKMPLVILLHGAGRDGLSMIEMWQQVAVKYQIALVAPDGPDKSWPLANPDPQLIIHLVGEMAKHYDIAPDQIFLFGHSAGADYAQILLTRTAGPWRAAALHGGFVPAAAMQPPQTAKPIRLYLGDNDDNFSVAEARDSMQAMARMGHQSDLIIMPAHSHWFYDIGPQIADDSWHWLAGLPKPD